MDVCLCASICDCLDDALVSPSVITHTAHRLSALLASHMPTDGTTATPTPAHAAHFEQLAHTAKELLSSPAAEHSAKAEALRTLITVTLLDGTLHSCVFIAKVAFPPIVWSEADGLW